MANVKRDGLYKPVPITATKNEWFELRQFLEDVEDTLADIFNPKMAQNRSRWLTRRWIRRIMNETEPTRRKHGKK